MALLTDHRDTSQSFAFYMEDAQIDVTIGTGV